MSRKEAIAELVEMIRQQGREGNVVVKTLEGLGVIKVSDIIKQPTDGLLYDLNRLPEVVVTFAEDPKWINDYAVYMVIKELKKYYDYCVANGIEIKE
jgi:hypothetical protein